MCICATERGPSERRDREEPQGQVAQVYGGEGAADGLRQRAQPRGVPQVLQAVA